MITAALWTNPTLHGRHGSLPKGHPRGDGQLISVLIEALVLSGCALPATASDCKSCLEFTSIAAKKMASFSGLVFDRGRPGLGRSYL